MVVSISQSALGREVPGNEMKSLEYNLRRTADDLRLRTFPVVAMHEFYIYFVCVLYGGPQVSRQMFDVNTAKLKKIRRHLFFTCYLSFRQALLFCNGLK